MRAAGLSKDASSLLLINIDRHATDLTVCSENQFLFTRNISLGSSDITEILKEQGQLLVENPEKIKQLWFVKEHEAAVVSPKERAMLEAGKRLQHEGTMLYKEVELTTSHYYQITHGGKIDKCIIFGEVVGNIGLLDFLKEKIDIPIEDFRLPASVTLAKEKEKEFVDLIPEYVHTLGAVFADPDFINLVSASSSKAKETGRGAALQSSSKIVPLAIFIFVALIIGIFGWIKGFNHYYKNQISAFKAKQTQLEQTTMQLMQVKKKMEVVESEKELYQFLSQRSPAYSTFILEICKAIPGENIVIDDLGIKNTQKPESFSREKDPAPLTFTLKGRVVGGVSKSDQATAFVLALEKSGYFENISININDQPRAQNNRGFDKNAGTQQSSEELSFSMDGNIVYAK